MKKSKFKLLLTAGIIAASLSSFSSFSQTKKLPDGTIVYSGGTKKLPNGTVVYKDGTSVAKSKTVTLPDGRVILQDGLATHADDTRQSKRKGKWLPPGQAKKIYGGSARDYAPGQQKKGGKSHSEWNDHEGKHKHDGKGKKA